MLLIVQQNSPLPTKWTTLCEVAFLIPKDVFSLLLLTISKNNPFFSLFLCLSVHLSLFLSRITVSFLYYTLCSLLDHLRFFFISYCSHDLKNNFPEMYCGFSFFFSDTLKAWSLIKYLISVFGSSLVKIYELPATICFCSSCDFFCSFCDLYCCSCDIFCNFKKYSIIVVNILYELLRAIVGILHYSCSFI